MTRRYLSLIAATLILPAAAMADMAGDADGDGVLTLEELRSVVPEISAESFAAMDANGDNVLDAEEVEAGVKAGMLPATDG